MWIFGKKDNKTDKKPEATQKGPPDMSKLGSKEEKIQALMAQMREVRAEIGEENLQKLAEKLKLDAMKKQMRHDIDNDPKKRDRLLDEIRFQARDKGDR